MLTRLRGGYVIDPVNGTDAMGDLWFEDGHIIAPPQDCKADQEHDVSGHVVMAGAIDIHSHIAGGGVNTARLLSRSRTARIVRAQRERPFPTSAGRLSRRVACTPS